VVIVTAFEFLLAVGVGTLVLILAVALIIEVLAQLRLVLSLDLVLGVPELTRLSLTALVLEEVPTDSLPLQPEELLHLRLVADVDRVWDLPG
jgi:hypothetical protein